MSETWRPVVGYEGFYEVSDRGRVRSLDRPQLVPRWGGTYMRRGRVLTPVLVPRPGGKNVLRVSLTAAGKRQSRVVHQLVLEAFVGPRPDGMQSLHWDDDPVNNRLSNLRWGTPRENQYDRIRNGNNDKANQTHCIHGHEFTPENTYRPNPRHRKCRTCCRIRERSRVRDRRRCAA